MFPRRPTHIAHTHAICSLTYVDACCVVPGLCMTEGIWFHFSPYPICHHHHHHLSYINGECAWAQCGKIHGIERHFIIFSIIIFSPICSVNLGDGITHYHIAIIFDTFKRSFGVPMPCIKRTRTQHTRSVLVHTKTKQNYREKEGEEQTEWNEWWAFTRHTCSRISANRNFGKIVLRRNKSGLSFCA